MQTSNEKRLNMPNWMWIFGAFLVMNIFISGIGAFAMANGEPAAPDWAIETHPMMVARDKAIAKESWFTTSFINNWYRWDTGWYLKISLLGYDVDDNSTGFQPLYPILIRGLGALGINYLLAALLLSRTSCLVALFLLFKITMDLYHSQENARRTVIFLLTFPAGFFLFVGYTEALTLALSLACIYLLTKNKWILAGLVGGLATLTRIQGVAIVFPMLWVALSGRYNNYLSLNISSSINLAKERLVWIQRNLYSTNVLLSIFSSLIPGFLIGSYNIYLKIVGFETIVGAYSNRGTEVVMPWVGFWELIKRFLYNHLWITDYIEIFLFILFILFFLIGVRELPIAFTLYNLAMIAIVFMRVYENNFFPGFMRYMLIIFPIFIIMGKAIKKTWQFYMLVCTFLFLNLIMAWAFVKWFWVA